MFENLLIHPRTRRQIEDFIKNPSHSLILTGPEGSGKLTLANAVAAATLHIERTRLASYPYYSLTNPEDPTITIDEIRSLQKLLTLKTPAVPNSYIRRVLCIVGAGRMRQEAQNAFLKSLEEPPADTCIILTAIANGDLLETIYSRVQRIDVLPVSETMARLFYSKQAISSSDLAKNYALSQGQVGLLNSLLQDQTHTLRDAVNTAKHLLSLPIGERLLQTDELSKDKIVIKLLLNALGRITHAALMSAANSGNEATIKRWKNSLAAVQTAVQSAGSNANTKLLLDNLFLNL